MKHTALSLAIASRLGDAMVTIAGDIARSHNVSDLMLGARHGRTEIGQIVGALSRAHRADNALAAHYGTRASRVLPESPAVESTPAVESPTAD